MELCLDCLKRLGIKYLADSLRMSFTDRKRITVKFYSTAQSKFYYGTISRTIVGQGCSVRQVFFGNSYELRPPATNMYFGIQSSSVARSLRQNTPIAPFGTKELISRTTALLFAAGIFGNGPESHPTATHNFARLVKFCNVGRRS